MGETHEVLSAVLSKSNSFLMWSSTISHSENEEFFSDRLVVGEKGHQLVLERNILVADLIFGMVWVVSNSAGIHLIKMALVSDSNDVCL